MPHAPMNPNFSKKISTYCRIVQSALVRGKKIISGRTGTVSGIIIMLGYVIAICGYIYWADSTRIRVPDGGYQTLFSACAYPVGEAGLGENDLACFRRELRAWIKQFGLAQTSAHFDAYIRSDEGVRLRGGACHALGHDLGEAALSSRYSATEILNSCSSVCEEGCFNGIGHAYVALHQDGNGIDSFCKPEDFSGPRTRTLACYHGFGHGFADVFGFDLEKNIRRCDSIHDTEGRFQCGHAVFMALSTIPPQIIKQAKLPPDIPAFCAALDDTYHSSCFIFSGYLIFGIGGGAQAAFETCGNVPHRWQEECSARIGESIFLSDKQPDHVAKYCKNISDPLMRKMCIGMAAKVAVTDSASRIEMGGAVCAAAEPSDQEYCFAEFGARIEETRGSDERTRVCALFPNQESYCLNQD